MREKPYDSAVFVCYYRVMNKISHSCNMIVRLSSEFLETIDWSLFRLPNAKQKDTPFDELPGEWQKEIIASAKIALYLVRVAQEQQAQVDDVFIEYVSSVVHEEWVKRNGAAVEEGLRVAYVDLPEEEKEKDRHYVRTAIDLLCST